jgi:hypothetical protein
MKRPPVVMRVQVRAEREKHSLWLPLFLLLPLALVIVIILSPLIVIAVIVLRVRRGHVWSLVAPYLPTLCSVRGIRAGWDLLCATPGLQVDVRNRHEKVYVSII